MDAVVIAAGTPKPEEALYSYTQGKPKALLDLCGKSMIQWVLDALEGAETVDQVVIVGLPADCGATSSKVTAFVKDHGSMLENVRAGVRKVLELAPQARQILLVSSDIPTIKSEMVNWVVNTCQQTDLDLYYHLVTRQVMEARFPGSMRSYTRLKDVEVCGGDLNVIRAMTVTSNDELWDRIVSARKSAFRQAALLGFDTLILLLFRAVTLEEAIKRVSKRLNMTGQAILSPYAEIGMDVDKPHQLELVRADLSRRASE